MRRFKLRKTPWLTVAGLAVLFAVVAVLIIYVLYRVAYAEKQRDLEQVVSSQAVLVEAIAQYEQRHSASDTYGATLPRIAEAYANQRLFDSSEELLFARLSGEKIVFLFARDSRGMKGIESVAVDHLNYRPLYLALTGKTGVMEAIDDRGNPVMAGYAAVPTLGVGIVNKVDLAEIRAPYWRAGLIAGGITLFGFTLGAALVIRVQSGLVRRLESSEQRLAGLLSFSPVGVFETDRDGNYTLVNEGWSKISGLSGEGALGRGWVAALHEEDRERISREWRAAVGKSVAFNAEYRFVTPHQQTRWVLGQAVAMRNGKNEIAGFVGTVTDITELKRVTEELLLKEHAINSALSAIVMADISGRMRYVNDAFLRMWGFASRDEVLGRHAVEFWESVAEAETAFSALAQTGAWAGELVGVRCDGQKMSIHFSGHLVMGRDGKPVGTMGSLADVSGYRAVENALRASEARLNEAQRIAHLGSWELDLVSGALVWSDEIFRIFEIDQDKFGASYEAFLNAIHPDDRDAVNRTYLDSVENKRPYEISHRLLMADGRIKYVSERCETLYGQDGKPIRSSGTVQDVSTRRNAELALESLNQTLEQRVAERTARLDEAQRIGHIGYWSWDVATGGLTWSDEIYRIFGYRPGEFQPSYERFIATLHPDDVARIKQSEHEAFSQGRRHSIDHRILMPNGEIRWVHEEAIAEMDEEGRPVSLAGTVQDITERKLAEQALLQAKEEAERANLAKSEFLARMSHELRTPMNAILGFSQLLETESLNAEQHGFVSEIHKAGDHLLELINELLDLSKIEAGRLALVLQPVPVCMIAEQAMQWVTPLLSQNNLTLRNQCKQGITALADATRLKQIMVNLLSNAAKYNRKGGSIGIDCRSVEEGWVRFSIADTGPGIPAEKLGQLFKPFERLGAEFTAVEGTGVGLALSQRLAELMGGRIGVDSSPGRGSTFWIDLPQAQE